MIKYRLTNAKKNKNLQVGDGLADIFKMVLPYAKNILPKLATTVGLSSIGALTSNAINKNKKKKDTIIKLTDTQVKKINDNLKKINDSQKFLINKLLYQKIKNGSGIFSFLLPTIVSMLPSLLSKGKGNNFFLK